MAGGSLDRPPPGLCERYAIEYDNVSMGTPAALRAARALLASEPQWRRLLLVAASRESYLLDYGNARSRFMFNFGDGAGAALLVRTRAATSSSARTRSPTARSRCR